jgi:uncharacterized protein (DUF433 family)
MFPSSVREDELSTKEAAVLAGVQERRVRRLVRELHVGHRAHGVHRHLFGSRDVLFLALTRAMPVSLDKKTSAALYTLVSRNLKESGRWKRRSSRLVLEDVVTIDAGKLTRDVQRRLQVYRSSLKRVTSSPETMGGELVFKGTRVSVAHVGALAARGIPLQEILEDFPRLGVADVELALLLHKMGRRPGRPRHPVQLQR